MNPEWAIKTMKLTNCWRERALEDKISVLDGPHYRRYGRNMFDAEGRKVSGNYRYKCFGAAKDLPGMGDLLKHGHHDYPKKRGPS